MTAQSQYTTIAQLNQRANPTDLVTTALRRINTNQQLNAFITVLNDAATQPGKSGPLHGIPIGIKDFYDTANVRTTAAFEKFKDRIPKADAVAVKTLKDAGAIIIGKTNMHQLGMGTTGLESYFGPARNPWNPDYIPGGSSSGSAAAVAAGLCYATLDTDAIGSCRLPAACCGVVGFKGTYGLISSKGILEGEKAEEAIVWLSHPAITTRSVQDTAIVLNVLAEKGQDFQAAMMEQKRLRVGTANNFKADKEVTSAFNTAVEAIKKIGCEVRAARAPFDMPQFGDLRTIEKDRKTIADRAFKDIDLLLLPTTVTTVLRVKDATGNAQALAPANTMFANYFGLPAISVPCGFDERGLPIGLQIVGKPWDEAAVLRLAHQFETATDAGKKHPIP
jgi:aspartyl-tRNA(Asn)/glutamyl-tRNA(Gln) amidotransferase subunit A